MKIKILVAIIIILVMIMAIKHVAVKVSGDRGLASEWNADHHIDDDVECNQHQHLQHVIENRTDWPAGPVVGQIIYRTDLNAAFMWDGTSWAPVAGGTHYWSCPGSAFTSDHPDIDDITILGAHSNQDGEQIFWANADGIVLAAPVNLPHGAVVIAIIVYGNAAASAETYELVRLDHLGVVDAIMAAANIGTADNIINQPTIDNENYLYSIVTDSIDTDDRVYGARIIYIL